MANDRVVKLIASGFPELVGDIEIYEGVLTHIRDDHNEAYARLDEVFSTITGGATHVYQSYTNATSLVFVNTECLGNGGDDPIRVPVKVFDDGKGIMTTAYFASSPNHGVLLWSKDQDAPVPSFKGRRRNDAK